MATIKSYTDLEQSNKLAEILPLESADMCWQKIYDENHLLSDYRIELLPFRLYSGLGIPCWSLAALLEQFEDTAGLARDYGLWFCYDNKKSYCTKHYDNPIDACYEIILKLHEIKML